MASDCDSEESANLLDVTIENNETNGTEVNEDEESVDSIPLNQLGLNASLPQNQMGMLDYSNNDQSFSFGSHVDSAYNSQSHSQYNIHPHCKHTSSITVCCFCKQTVESVNPENDICDGDVLNASGSCIFSNFDDIYDSC
jgi:hypothetical protein